MLSTSNDRARRVGEGPAINHEAGSRAEARPPSIQEAGFGDGASHNRRGNPVEFFCSLETGQSNATASPQAESGMASLRTGGGQSSAGDLGDIHYLCLQNRTLLSSRLGDKTLGGTVLTYLCSVQRCTQNVLSRFECVFGDTLLFRLYKKHK